MRTKDTRGFVNQVALCLLITIGCGGSVGLGTVWIRHQISLIADHNRVLKQQLDIVERHIAETQALVEEEQSNDVLRTRNEAMHLGLVPMTQAQIVAVTEDPVARLAARSNREVFGERPAAVHVKFQLAMGGR
jgi:hypothetical protein